MKEIETAAKDEFGRAVIENRKNLALSGIENIVSFDENFVVLDTGRSLISVDGEGLQMLKMDTQSGEVEIEGKINGLVYSDKRSGSKESGGIFRAFKRP